MKKKRRSISEITHLITQYSKCGLTLSSFCRQHSLCYMTFKNWQKKYTAIPASFSEIKIPFISNSESNQITLRLPGKLEVLFPLSIAPEYLVQIISKFHDLSGDRC